jgi:hypothetical protein
MKKRGQISKLFVFIMMLIIAGVIVLLASVFLTRIFNSRDRAQLIKFETELIEHTGKVGYADSRELKLYAPEFITRVCIYDRRRNHSTDVADWYNPKLDTLIPEGHNVFMLKGDELEYNFRADRLALASKAIECFRVRTGLLTLRVKGGDFGAVVVSEV